ncbi:hypothetical protein FDG95_gp583 [Pectobacterium phage vB_PcaM_CBB]|uniref:Uncharacterized protein n=1 Tax=Pectobacterium phage vB_PcaM_CBB TaxID=2772511 RepID=A0A1L2CVD3_9CAUD|nr:hypothetical protein FDG95_gp583 [Pectobacterium phage vB_PcaM_CBB]AMM43959.1 hypothetical protein CBB_396 [Pectobacterium phage vB_PcaM_CBB]
MTKVVRKRRVLDNDEFKTLDIHRNLWRRLCAGEPQLVVTETYEEPEKLFGQYFAVFNHFMNKGLLRVITIDELDPSEHEFTVIK